MNQEKYLESILRAAPAPTPPAGLKDCLLEQIHLPRRQETPSRQLRPPANWLSRWWPVLAPAAASVACAVALTAQQLEIHDLRQTLKALAPNANAVRGTEDGLMDAGVAATDSTVTQEQEIARLKALAGQLTAQVTELEGMQAENGRLRAQLGKVSQPTWALPAEDEEALAKAKEHAQAVECANHLKQLGLAVKVWSLDNTNLYPPNIIEMSNEVSSLKVPLCPADQARQPAASWPAFTPANSSYEYLTPSVLNPDPNLVVFRCPIHGSVTLGDGSVQMGVAKTHPEAFVVRNGRLYMEVPKTQPDQTEPAASSNSGNSDPNP
jgi:hypothetical protein